MLFHQVQGAVCILKSKGVFKQVDVFVRGKRIFAKWGGGYIGLKAHNGGTTVPTVSWDHLEGVDFVSEGFDLVTLSPMRSVA